MPGSSQTTRFFTRLSHHRHFRIPQNRGQSHNPYGYMKINFLVLIFTSVLLCALPACVTSPTPTAQDESIRQALSNAKYILEDTPIKMVHLKNGFYKKEFTAGTSDLIEVQLLEERAFGDINGDGTEDAAVILKVYTGGTGEYYCLELMINKKGSPKPLPDVFLGDRIAVKSLVIRPGSVLVNMLDRKPDEGMAADPTVEVKRTFKLIGGKLTELK